MNKFAKIAVGVTLAAAFATTAGVLAGCSSDKSGEAYALTHGAGYVGYAKITYSKDNEVKDLILTEVCLPTEVEATDNVAAEDKVAAKVSSHGKIVDATYFKKISFGGVTFTYDGTLTEAGVSKGYMNGTQTILEYLATEANCKTYYQAVTTNAVKVTVGGAEKTDIINNAALSKEVNGYWERKDKDDNTYSRWKMNRDATVKYVKENGTSKLTQLVKSTTEVDDLKEDKQVMPWTDGTVVTGATWNDLNADTTGKGYLSYAQLILKADEAAK